MTSNVANAMSRVERIECVAHDIVICGKEDAVKQPLPELEAEIRMFAWAWDVQLNPYEIKLLCFLYYAQAPFPRK